VQQPLQVAIMSLLFYLSAGVGSVLYSRIPIPITRSTSMKCDICIETALGQPAHTLAHESDLIRLRAKFYLITATHLTSPPRCAPDLRRSNPRTPPDLATGEVEPAHLATACQCSPHLVFWRLDYIACTTNQRLTPCIARVLPGLYFDSVGAGSASDRCDDYLVTGHAVSWCRRRVDPNGVRPGGGNGPD
jgi:hypothetical protein